MFFNIVRQFRQPNESSPLGVITVPYRELLSKSYLKLRVSMLSAQMHLAGIEDVICCVLSMSSAPTIEFDGIKFISSRELSSFVKGRPCVFVGQDQYHVPDDWLRNLLEKSQASDMMQTVEAAKDGNHPAHLRLRGNFVVTPSSLSTRVAKHIVAGRTQPHDMKTCFDGLGIKSNLNPITAENVHSMYGQAFRLDKPVSFVIETNNSCNYHCLMCPYHGGRQSSKPTFLKPGTYSDMPFEMFEKIVDEIATLERPYEDENTIATVTPYRRGEFLLYPHWREALECISSRENLRSYFSTNGSKWTDDDIDFIMDIKLEQIQISVNGHTSEIHKRLRLNDEFDKVVSTIERIRERRRKLKSDLPYIQICNVVNDRNIAENEDYISFWKQYADGVFLSPENFMEDGNSNKNYLMNFSKMPIPDDSIRPPCSMVKDSVWIDADGKVNLCMGSKLTILGDYADLSISEIINLSGRQDVGEAHASGNYDTGVCSNCQQWYNQLIEVTDNGPDEETLSSPSFIYYKNKRKSLVDGAIKIEE